MLFPALLNCPYRRASLEQPAPLPEVEGLRSWHGPNELFVQLGNASASKAESPGRRCANEKSQKAQGLKDRRLFVSFPSWSAASSETPVRQGERQRCHQLRICFCSSRERKYCGGVVRDRAWLSLNQPSTHRNGETLLPPLVP